MSSNLTGNIICCGVGVHPHPQNSSGPIHPSIENHDPRLYTQQIKKGTHTLGTIHPPKN